MFEEGEPPDEKEKKVPEKKKLRSTLGLEKQPLI